MEETALSLHHAVVEEWKAQVPAQLTEVTSPEDVRPEAIPSSFTTRIQVCRAAYLRIVAAAERLLNLIYKAERFSSKS